MVKYSQLPIAHEAVSVHLGCKEAQQHFSRNASRHSAWRLHA